MGEGMSATAGIVELCQVEGNDDLHEFGGGHGNKGNDFARFWLINELLALTEPGGSRGSFCALGVVGLSDLVRR